VNKFVDVEISIVSKHSDYIIEELFHRFPSVKHLIYKSSIQSKQTMICSIDGFKHLSNASFFADLLVALPKHMSIIKDCQQLEKDNFTYRFYYLKKSNISYSIH